MKSERIEVSLVKQYLVDRESVSLKELEKNRDDAFAAFAAVSGTTYQAYAADTVPYNAFYDAVYHNAYAADAAYYVARSDSLATYDYDSVEAKRHVQEYDALIKQGE